MSPHREAGNALTLTLVAAALLIPLGALAVLHARATLLVQQNLRGETEAFYSAEAGLERATATLQPAVAVASVLAGPDGISGTADDGVFPFDHAHGVLPTLRYDVHVSQVNADLLQLSATGYGSRSATKVLERLVQRAQQPYSPGAIYAGAGGVPHFGASGFVINGFDHVASNIIGTPTGPGAALPALTYGSEEAARAARNELPAADASRLVGAGTTPSIAHDQPLDASAIAARAAMAPPAMRYAYGTVSADMTLGTPGAPQLTIIDGDAVVEGTWSGNGILVIRGRFTVRGRLDFTGLLIAAGDVMFDAGCDVAIRGAVWLSAPALQALGSGGVAACSACLATVDVAFPDVLPHQYEPRGWRELS